MRTGLRAVHDLGHIPSLLGEYHTVIAYSRLKNSDLNREDVRREDQGTSKGAELSSQLAWRLPNVEHLLLLYPSIGDNASPW
jgi:hypothetical protein